MPVPNNRRTQINNRLKFNISTPSNDSTMRKIIAQALIRLLEQKDKKTSNLQILTLCTKSHTKPHRIWSYQKSTSKI